MTKAAGTVKPSKVTATLSGGDGVHPGKLTLVFAAGALRTGGTVAFGIDRDLVATHAGGNSADLLSNAKVKVQVFDRGVTTTIKGKITNRTGTGYSPAVGYGLIDAAAALQQCSRQAEDRRFTSARRSVR